MKQLALLVFIVPMLTFGQYSINEDYFQVPVDTIQSKQDTIKHHSIKAAILLSAALPGAGQVYNHIAMPKGKRKAFWKVPLIYAGLGVTGYFLITNEKTKNRLRNEYDQRLDLGIDYIDEEWKDYDLNGVLELHDQYLTWRDLSILGLGAVYLIQVIDAGVEAHFVSFDVSEDLSLTVNPVFYTGKNFGMSLTLNFR